MDLISLIITLVILGLIMWLVMWFVGFVGVPEPFRKVIIVLVGLVVFIFILNILLSLVGHPIMNVAPLHFR